MEKKEIEKCERVLSAFDDFLLTVPELDIAKLRKGGYFLIFDGLNPTAEINTAADLCRALIGELTYDCDKNSCEKILQLYAEKLPEFSFLFDSEKYCKTL